ncbi:MAG: hypothetical protein J6Y98_04480 [Bacteroidales bacterium]|nr:hypothetical protein [Bacteroidales bacterium]
MKQATDYKQACELSKLRNFQEPDMVMEHFWATPNHYPLHLKCDERHIQYDEDIDIVPTWSLGKLIEGLPGSITVADEEDDLIAIEYDLHICPDKDFAIVNYVTCDNSETLFETSGLNLVDAVYKMIMKLKDWGWYNEPIHEN